MKIARASILCALLSCGVAFANPPATQNPILVGLPAPVTVYNGTAVDATAQTTYTFASQPIGTAVSNRFVVVCTGVMGAATGSLSGVTIGGSAAASLVAITAANNATGCFGLVVAAGTTATVAVTVSGLGSRAAISIYSIYNLVSTTPTSTCSSSTGNPISCSLTNIFGNTVIAFVAANYTDAGSVTWTGVTRDVTGTTGGVPYSSASIIGAASITPAATLPNSPAQEALVALSLG